MIILIDWCPLLEGKFIDVYSILINALYVLML